jgi:hypothetical protein
MDYRERRAACRISDAGERGTSYAVLFLYRNSTTTPMRELRGRKRIEQWRPTRYTLREKSYSFAVMDLSYCKRGLEVDENADCTMVQLSFLLRSFLVFILFYFVFVFWIQVC